ncbi:fatty acid desaturase [Thermoleptolyngbya sp. C42_A2020_037]|uniref:fatty acid desaturase n=1 Tax=Thermoleptolyngbya sp. C42_A2020_037 TaxID=2747799 RepID=UPI0025ED5359|nr:fatty acid desaturase [Thermoleptolyngbya sp. C42_A2020_037]
MAGIFLAAVILTGWVVSLLLFLLVDSASLSVPGVVFAVLLRTFLHTGLFVIGHDAMHQNLLPNHRRINHCIGAIAVWLYAAIAYSTCCANHHQHHRYPEQTRDPDFHDGTHTHPLCWYSKFIREYLSVSSILGLLGGWGLLLWGMSQVVPMAWSRVVLFVLLPFVLSSVQLFVFGTYLPHRGESGHQVPESLRPGDRTLNPSQTQWRPWLWSFFTCYHFGQYHPLHHRFPRVPWYQLPSFREKR